MPQTCKTYLLMWQKTKYAKLPRAKIACKIHRKAVWGKKRRKACWLTNTSESLGYVTVSNFHHQRKEVHLTEPSGGSLHHAGATGGADGAAKPRPAHQPDIVQESLRSGLPTLHLVLTTTLQGQSQTLFTWRCRYYKCILGNYMGMRWSCKTEILFRIGQKQVNFRFRFTINYFPVFFLLVASIFSSFYSLLLVPDIYFFPPSTLLCFLSSGG